MDNSYLDAFFKSNEFNSLAEESKALIKDFVREVSGKPQMEAVSVFMEYHEKLSRSGKIDSAAQQMLIRSLKSGLNPSNKKKFDIIEKMFFKS